MKKLLLLLTLAAMAGAASANPDVGVSVSVSQPGVYGRVDIGRVPSPPVLMRPQPVIIVPGPVAVQPPEPIYMHVPPGHSRNWRKHCRRYNACGQPVYFVRDDWYQRHYRPHHHDHHDRYERRDERHDHRDDDRRHHHGDGRDR
jgi:hypothetical protein